MPVCPVYPILPYIAAASNEKVLSEHVRTAKAEIRLRASDSEGSDQTARRHLSLRFPLIESLDTIECINAEKMPG